MNEFSTQRLTASIPTVNDLDSLFEICSDARLWHHRPSSRHTSMSQTDAMLQRWIDSWGTHQLGTWIIRTHDSPQVIGYGGCTVVAENYWNLGYRFKAETHGQGYATEIAQAALAEARKVKPDIPVIASILEHNSASGAVAQKIGMELAYRGLDQGNPDPSAVRLIYADRVLSFIQLQKVILH